MKETNIVELAMKTEMDAMDFYARAAGKTSHPVGKKMFLSIIEDEKRHLELLKCIFSGMDIELPEETSPMRKIKTVFEENRELMLGCVAATTDETGALEIAMKMEKESVDFYEKAARQTENAREKTIFERLVKEEQEHYEIFSNTYQFLADSGNWFMWQEHSIVDGGTPWA
ncbi:MAG: ferritin family protein [Nitrospiraceae bacterium]|nr:ferritin family protein [Nitrospiraceae bacterium]